MPGSVDILPGGQVVLQPAKPEAFHAGRKLSSDLSTKGTSLQKKFCGTMKNKFGFRCIVECPRTLSFFVTFSFHVIHLLFITVSNTVKIFRNILFILAAADNNVT